MKRRERERQRKSGGGQMKGKKGREKEKREEKERRRRRKIGPMVIDYLPRIPRIPYSDRPHGTKIEPSIADAPHSLSLFSLSPSPLPPSLSLDRSVSTGPRYSSIFLQQDARTRNFQRSGKRDALIKRAQI